MWPGESSGSVAPCHARPARQDLAERVRSSPAVSRAVRGGTRAATQPASRSRTDHRPPPGPAAARLRAPRGESETPRGARPRAHHPDPPTPGHASTNISSQRSAVHVLNVSYMYGYAHTRHIPKPGCGVSAQPQPQRACAALRSTHDSDSTGCALSRHKHPFTRS